MLLQRYTFLVVLLIMLTSGYSLTVRPNRYQADISTEFTSNLQEAYHEVFKLKFVSARKLLSVEKKENPFRIFLENRMEMIELIATEDAEKFEKIKQNEEKRLDLLENFDTKSPYRKFLEAQIILDWALQKIRFGYEVRAGWAVIRAFKLLEENRKQFPNFKPNLVPLGVLHVLIGSVPENQQWILKFLGMNGSVKQGLAELQVASTDKIWGLEAKFYKLFIKAYILKFTTQTNTEITKWVESQPDNMAFQFFGTAASMKGNRAAQAETFLNNWKSGGEYAVVPIRNLYAGEINLTKGAYNQAVIDYERYLKTFVGKSFKKDACFRIAVGYLLQDDWKRAEQYLLRINKVGAAITETDKLAQKNYENYVETKQLPNKNLLKARFLFDGGYYEKALKTLESLTENSFETLQEKVEYNYRLGRITEKMLETDKAIRFYERTISLSSTNNWYFAPMSALNLGYLHLQKGNKNLAKRYFQRAISYKNHDYKNSVDTKAKAALNGL